MEKRKFGNIEVSSIGLGCMGFIHAYGKGPSEEESIRLVHLLLKMDVICSIPLKCIHF